MQQRRLTPGVGHVLYLGAIVVMLSLSLPAGLLMMKSSPPVYYLIMAVMEMLMMLIPILVLKYARGLDVRQDLHMRPCHPGAIPLALLLAVVTYPIMAVVNAFWQALLVTLGGTLPNIELPGLDNWGYFSIAVGAVALVPALAEELLFRGALLASYKDLGKWKAVLLSALLFGLMHMQIYSLLALCLLGLIMALLTWRTGSIWPAITFHFTNNLIALGLYAYLLRAENPPAELGLEAATTAPAIIQAGLALLPFAALAGLLFVGIWYAIRSIHPADSALAPQQGPTPVTGLWGKLALIAALVMAVGMVLVTTIMLFVGDFNALMPQ